MFGLDKFGGIGLHRIQRFLSEFAIDTQRLSERSLVITGTNGKGSTARLASAALGAHGLTAGCFTSPHMFDVCERFRIGDDQIDRTTFDRLSGTVLAFNETLPDDDRLGAFQFLFLVAILWFEETDPAAIVWEAGIGGRYDPVRMVRAKVGALTSVELEHTQVLGTTEELIAYDKVDAVEPGGDIVLSPLVQPELRDRIETYMSLSGKTPVFIRDHERTEGMVNTSNGVQFDLATKFGEPRHIGLALIGAHQVSNAVTAAHLVEAWLSKQSLAYDADATWSALATVQIPGRLEKISARPDVWIDVGHTPRAIDEVTKAFLEFQPAERTLVVFGVSASKEVDAIAAIVASRFPNVILTHAHKSGADPGRFRDVFDRGGGSICVANSVEQAAHDARDRAQAEGLDILVIGGLFLAAEFETAWNGGDPRTIEFL